MEILRFPYRLAVTGLMVIMALVCLIYVDHARADESNDNDTVLFSDDFSGDLSNWSDLIGNWSTDQGELYGQGGAEYHIDGAIYAGDTSWTDYSLQAKVIFINRSAQLILRSNGHWQNEYILEFWENGYFNSNSYQVVKYKDGISYDLSGGVVPSRVLITNPCIIKVMASGNRLFIFVNDQFMAEIDDPDPLSSGRIGLGLKYNDEVRFDDVVVETLPSIMILPGQQASYGAPGQVISYSFELQNFSGQTDSFSLETLPGNSWMTTPISDVVGPIPDDQGVTFTVDVEIPADAQAGQSDQATIMASSILSPGVYTGTAVINTSAPSDQLAYVTQSNNMLAVIDQKFHTIIGTVDIEAMGCLGASRARLMPSGTMLYLLCSTSSNLLVLHVPEMTVAYSLVFPTGTASDIIFRSDERYALISFSNWTMLQVLDIQAQELTTNIPLEGEDQISNLETSPSGSVFYASGGMGQGKIYVIDPQTFSIVSIIVHGSYIVDVVASPDGKWIYADEFSMGGILIIDATTLEIVGEIGDYELTGMALSPDGSTIYAGQGDGGTVSVYDIATRTKEKSIYIGGSVSELDMNCTGSEIYIGASNPRVSVFNTSTDDLEEIIPTAGISYGIATCPQYYSPFAASMQVHQPSAPPRGQLNYSIIATNLITDVIQNVLITDTLPISLTYLDGSLAASSGSASYHDGVITWSGAITPGESVEVGFTAMVSAAAKIGSKITNQASFEAEGVVLQRSTTIQVVNYRAYIACAHKACLPTFIDDFSDANSGWSVSAGETYSLGYVNGEYRMTVNPGWIAWTFQDFGSYDFAAEIDTRAASSLSGAAGIMFGVNDYGFYLFEVSDGRFSLWRVYAPDYWYWTPLIDWTTSPAVHPGNQVNRLKVVRQGDRITLYANGILIGSVDDGSYQSTWLGMAVESYDHYFDARFDNFAFYSGACIGGKSLILSTDRPSFAGANAIQSGSDYSLTEGRHDR